MSAFRLETVTTRLGYDCSSLSPSAHALERSVEFKRAAEAHFDRLFDPWRQDRSFTAPYAGRLRPGTTLQPDAHGDIDPQQVLDLAREHLTNHARGAAAVQVAGAHADHCVWDPVRKEWINIGGVHVDLDGQPLTADGAVDDFEAAYRAHRSGLPPTFDADLQGLRAMRASLFVSWGV